MFFVLGVRLVPSLESAVESPISVKGSLAVVNANELSWRDGMNLPIGGEVRVRIKC